MQVGLIADTHDNLESIEEAVNIFNNGKVQVVLHAGDYNSPFTAKIFKNLEAKLIGVYGNTDGEREGLRNQYSKIGTEIKGDFAEIILENKNIALYHGTESSFVNALAKSGDYDVVVHGHTHNRRFEKTGNTIVTNPGEACGYITGKGSIAILELETLKVEFTELGLT